MCPPLSLVNKIIVFVYAPVSLRASITWPIPLSICSINAINLDLFSDKFGSLFFTLSNHSFGRSEEHTSELQSRGHLVCRLLLEKKKNNLYYLSYVFLIIYAHHQDLHSFPTRRSSDLK